MRASWASNSELVSVAPQPHCAPEWKMPYTQMTSQSAWLTLSLMFTLEKNALQNN